MSPPLLAAFLACLALLTGCGTSATRGARDRVTLAVPANLVGGLVLLAEAKGYLAAEGLEVTLQKQPFGKPALDSVLDGHADLGFCAEVPLVLSILHGRPACVIATVSSSRTSTYMLARKAAGIRSPRDLAGKRVGVSLGSSGSFFLDCLLVMHGLPAQAVQVIDMKPAEMQGALGSGKVDAVVSWVPETFVMEEHFGDAVTAFPAQELFLETHDLVARREFIRQHPEVVEKVLRGLTKAETLVHDHPGEAGRIMAKSLDLAPGVAAKLFSRTRFNVRLEQTLLMLMDEEARWALRSGLADRQELPNFQDYLELGPLLKVEPEAVRIIR